VLIAVLVVGGIAAWYLGLRKGAYAAGATAVLCVVAALVPAWEWPIYLALSAGVVGIIAFGARTQRPADSQLAVQWLRHRLKKLLRRGP
jgi:hypothetical protein